MYQCSYVIIFLRTDVRMLLLYLCSYIHNYVPIFLCWGGVGNHRWGGPSSALSPCVVFDRHCERAVAELNDVDDEGATALHFAARYKRMRILSDANDEVIYLCPQLSV